MKQCPKCQHKNPDDLEFCESCGQDLKNVRSRDDLVGTEHDIAGMFFSKIEEWIGPYVKKAQDYAYDKKVASSYSVSTPQFTEAGEANSQFVDSGETIQATVGVSYVQSFMSGSGFKNGAAILTDKRLYYFGKSYSNVGRGASTTTEEGIISIDEITFTRFVHGSPIGYLIMAIICILPGVMLFGNSFGSTDSVAGVFGMTGLILALLGSLCLIVYFVGRSTVMEIAFPGGKYCFDSRWHSVSSMREFQRQIHLLKDGLKAGQRNEKQKDAEVLK